MGRLPGLVSGRQADRIPALAPVHRVGSPAVPSTVSPLGGPERRLLDLPVATLSWSPDGQWLAAAKGRLGTDPPGGIELISVGNGRTRPVTTPRGAASTIPRRSRRTAGRPPTLPAKGRRSFQPAKSRSSRSTPSSRSRRSSDADTPEGYWIVGIAWTRDGRAIVFGTRRVGGRSGGSARMEPLRPSAWRWEGAPPSGRRRRVVATGLPSFARPVTRTSWCCGMVGRPCR